MYQRRRSVLLATVALSRVLVLSAVLMVVTGTQPVSNHTTTTTTHPTAAAVDTLTGVPVVVVDHTHGQWAGVQRAVDGWNRSPYVRLQVADACRPGVYCVTLRAVDKGATWWGAHTLPRDTTRATVTLTLGVRDSAYPTEDGQASVVCHELGHTLGLTHPTRSERVAFPDRAGCIAATNKHHTTPVASEADLVKLQRLATGLEVGEGWGAVGGLPLAVRQAAQG